MKPNLAQLRAFGCKTYIHVPQENINKLDARARTGILVGYDFNSKAYRCFLPEEKKILVTQDVVYDEHSIGWRTGTRATSVDTTYSWKLPEPSSQKPTEWEISRQGEPTSTLSPTEEAQGSEHQRVLEELPALEGLTNTPPASPTSLGDPVTVIPPDDTMVTINTDDQRQPDHQLPRRSARECRPPKRFQDYISYLAEEEPLTFAEASNLPQWRNAMNSEIASIHENHTWKLEERPADYKPITAKWIYKFKTGSDGVKLVYKLRHVW
ncbi:hypothetical protein R1flu_013542 [Riccia fluitans]|uniref:Retroviral polymerase SH3-like domain-containing protein n=1 Tax=Riccia fluitans TaxID=41844 RepID=A0ABD1YDJ4_9MARC